MSELVKVAGQQLDVGDKMQARNNLMRMLRAEIIGPAGGEMEVLKERPDKRYLMAMLFPKNATAAQIINEEAALNGDPEGDASRTDSGEEVDSPTDLMFQRLPASVGISFAVSGTEPIVLEATIAAATYLEVAKTAGRGKNWTRAPQSAGEERCSINLSGSEPSRIKVLLGRATLHSIVRPGPEKSRIVTVSLINDAEVKPGDRFSAAECLYQIALEVSCSQPLRAWPTPERLFNDPEEDELILQYRHRPALAVGHGCAADWRQSENGKTSVWVEFMPSVEIAPITAEIPSMSETAQASLSLKFLQSETVRPAELFKALQAFIGEYATWRRQLETIQTPEASSDARSRILARIDQAVARMRAGLELLQSDEDALRCFRLANKAMLLQMVFAGRVKGAEKSQKIETSPIDADAAKWSSLRWRPFQLAFQLISLCGLWSDGHEDREIVDLIWFPTGGGKTEAYLAVAAFEMLRRRLVSGTAGGGTAILMRYTLRLLTQQQFQRAGHLICALEILRGDLGDALGREPFSLGLWVGNEVTPGSAPKADEIFDRRLRQEVGAVSNPFTLLRCPACGTSIVPPELTMPGAVECGIRSSTTDFRFFCPELSCSFHQEIPVQIVDELLYQRPPTILLATLDKFASMAWKEEAARFFGSRTKSEIQINPPSLVIQDELHLISGPLGTVAGLYEAAIDVAISARGCMPKILASTATTRRAAEQGLALYGRSVQVFPPAGLNAGDSFFTRTVEGAGPGRLYVGGMAQGHTPTFSNVLVSAALMSTVPRLELQPEDEDSWWTLVAYHNSRRELGRSLTLARDDIPSRIIALQGRSGPGSRKVEVVEELSANIKGDAIPVVLEALSRPKTTGLAVDYLGCTNMLSVGVDVDRLGLMLVLGQPKTASEYIQATSRVGRSSKHLPGLVFALYMPTKPRDRSHYEMFRPFHEAMYRHVEPSSVTPYALPARQRAFHAAVISAVRMATNLSKNENAADFQGSDLIIRQLLNRLYERMKKADPTEKFGIEAAAKEIEGWWESLASAGLRYSTSPNARNYRSLIKGFGEMGQEQARETLHSMRHVDSGVRVKIDGQESGASR